MGSRPKPWTTNQMGSHRKSHSIPERGTQLWPLPHRENVDISNLPQPRLPKPTEWTSSEVQTPEETPAGSSGWGHLIQISILWVGLGVPVVWCLWGILGPSPVLPEAPAGCWRQATQKQDNFRPFPPSPVECQEARNGPSRLQKSWGNYYYYLWPPIMAGATLYQE